MRMLCWHLLIFLLVGGRVVGVDVEPEYAEAREGSDAELPCNLQPVHPPDKVNLVVWHKGDEEAALYKYDMRGARGQHWADPSVVDRYFLRMLDGDRALLTISLTRLSDEAVYHCRVDFNRSPTRYTHVNLTVVGKTRTKDKYRVVYTDHQRVELEKEFYYSRYITIRRKAELASNLGLSERQVKIWFQNRRAKERKQVKKREELHQKESSTIIHQQQHPGLLQQNHQTQVTHPIVPVPVGPLM